MIKFKKIHPNAKLPEYGSELAAGLDLRTVDSVTIPAGQRALLRTGLQLAYMRGNSVGLIWPRSKLAAKKGIDVLAGVIDADYRGEVMISLLNTSADPVEICAGDKVAQMLVQHILCPVVLEVDHAEDTQRGQSGINSAEMRLR